DEGARYSPSARMQRRTPPIDRRRGHAYDAARPKEATMRKSRVAWMSLVLCVAAVRGLADSESPAYGTIAVPGDFATLQAAVDAAHAGETIIVTDGKYTGVVVSGAWRNGLQIYAAGGAAIEQSDASPAITIRDTTGVGVHGFVVRSEGDGV